MKNNVLCILGMHRSGSSVTANWLQSCGLFIGDKLLRPDFSNVNGHFEDLEFLDLHKSILSAHHLPISGLDNIAEIELSTDEILAMSNLVEKKNRSNAEWGWKEPRTILFLKEYTKILPDLKVFYLHRDSATIVHSLVNREITRMIHHLYSRNLIKKYIRLLGFHFTIHKKRKVLFAHYDKVLVAYYQHLIKSFEGISRKNLLVLDLDEISEKDHQIIDFLTIEWGFSLRYSAFSEVFQADFITKKKRTDQFKLSQECDILCKKLLSFRYLA